MSFIEFTLRVVTYAAMFYSGLLFGRITFSNRVSKYAEAFRSSTETMRDVNPKYKSMILMLSSITSLLYTINISGLTLLNRNRKSDDDPESMVNEVMTDLAMCFTHERIEMIERDE